MKERLIISSVLFALISLISGCGGGSSGTGTTRVFEGTILTIDNTPVAGATITVVDSGDQSVTNAEGRFSLATPTTPGNIKLAITADGVETSVIVPALSEHPSTVKLDVTIDPRTAAATVTKFEVVAKMAGACEVYFVNDQVIRQSAPTPAELRCTVKVFVNEDGQPQASVPFALQYRACDPNSSWITVKTAKTFSGDRLGMGQLGFSYVDDEVHCVYRLITPYGVTGVEGVVEEIHTLTKQNFDLTGQ